MSAIKEINEIYNSTPKERGWSLAEHLENLGPSLLEILVSHLTFGKGHPNLELRLSFSTNVILVLSFHTQARVSSIGGLVTELADYRSQGLDDLRG